MPLVKTGPGGGHAFSPDHPEEFKVIFYGGSAFKEGEEDAFRRFAHRELYAEKMGKAPPDGASNEQLRREVEQAAGQKVKINLVVLRINEDDRPGSFINQMGSLGKFLNASRNRFLADAIGELETIGAIKSKAGEQLSKDKFKLCLALLKVQEKDEGEGSKFLNEENAKALRELRGSADLKNLFRNAEEALLKNRSEKDAANGTAEKYTYRGQDSRDRSSANGL